MENRLKIASRLDNILVVILGIYLLLFPLLITTLTTDAYVIPKQAGLALVVIAGLMIMGIRGVLAGNIKLRKTPFDLPLILMAVAALLSAIFAVNRFDSLITLVPYVMAILFFFIITNTAKKETRFKLLSRGINNRFYRCFPYHSTVLFKNLCLSFPICKIPNIYHFRSSF